MKYALVYNRTSKYMNDADEIIFEFKHNPELFKSLLNSGERFLQKRVVISVSEVESRFYYTVVNQVKQIKETLGLNIAIKFDNYHSSLNSIIQDLHAAGIDYFFSNRVSTWTEFYGLISLGVSDIYVVEDMCFQLTKAGAVAHANSISLRTFANICQTSWDGIDLIKSFFMRPEDAQIYNAFIDVCEFYFETPQEQDIYYEVYAKDQKWFGDLREIIKGLDTSLDSRYITPSFALTRVRCDRRCLKGEYCKICDRTKETTEILQRKNARETDN